MLWSQTAIPGPPTLLVVDASCNSQGWEGGFCDRIFNVLIRKGIALAGKAPLRAKCPKDLAEICQDRNSFNSILLVCHGDRVHVGEDSILATYWSWLSGYQALGPKLLAICTFEEYDPDTSQAILEADDSFASLAIVPQSPLSSRAAGLFYMKFFTELGDHSTDSVTGRMVWFSCSKARELLKRRRLPGQFGMRC